MAAALIILGALSCPTMSFGLAPKQRTDHNWAGYAITAQTPLQQIRGVWTQPSITCGERPTYSAFWVGLGGFKPKARLLEQIGTKTRCVSGRPDVSAFYEIYPTLGGRLGLTILPGDQIVASVTVLGHRVSMSLYNATIHQGRTRNFLIGKPDTSSAEWIAEAPAFSCGNNCLFLLPLANFGEITFTEAEASTNSARMEAITSTTFSANQLQLRDKKGLTSKKPGRPLAHGSEGEAAAGDLTSTGTSFGVTWER